MPSESFIFNSSGANGAINRSIDGSRFTVQFNEPFFLPANARNARLSVSSAEIWNVSPNISADLKNNIFQISDNNGIHTIEIETGLYDIDSLTKQIIYQVNNIPFLRPSFPFQDMITITSSESTNRVYFEYKYNATVANLDILWANSTVRDIFGFTATSPTRPANPSTPTTTFTVISDSFPQFNVYNNFVIHSNLVDQGVRLNNSFDQIICTIPIKASVGEINHYQAIQPYIFSTCNNLIGVQSQKWSATFWLTSETNVPLDQRGEYWSFVLLIEWLDSDETE